MNLEDYEAIEKFCRKQLNKTHCPYLSKRYEQGYKDGIKSIMSYLHSYKKYNEEEKGNSTIKNLNLDLPFNILDQRSDQIFKIVYEGDKNE